MGHNIRSPCIPPIREPLVICVLFKDLVCQMLTHFTWSELELGNPENLFLMDHMISDDALVKHSLKCITDFIIYFNTCMFVYLDHIPLIGRYSAK